LEADFGCYYGLLNLDDPDNTDFSLLLSLGDFLYGITIGAASPLSAGDFLGSLKVIDISRFLVGGPSSYDISYLDLIRK